jgi:hypothetical protein
VRVFVPESERRRSGRERVAINYAEKYGLDDDDDVAAARRRVVSSTRKKQNLASMSDGDFARRRFSVGARVYDSELGVTCHWCRQKTVETHVFCTAEACAERRSAPLAFCGMCLRNRHGEDIDAAVASGIWQCPKCRGSCGDGCVTCCNCGPCRKAHGLPPTHQVIQLARGAGFDNVHDYLVHGATGLSPAALLERKKAFNWGKWLAEGFRPAKTKTASTKAAAEGAKADEATKTNTKVSATKETPRRTSKTIAVVDVAAELRARRAAALAEKNAESSDGDEDFAVRAAPATPSPSKGAPGSHLRKRPWAVAIGSMGASTPSSARARRGVGRPASPATPEGGEEGSAAASSRARQKRAERKSSSSESSSEPFASPRKARKEGAFSRQGDIRAMFAAGKEGARATRARAARAA